MSKIRVLVRIYAVTGSTAVTFLRKIVTPLFPKSDTTVTPLHCTLHSLLSYLKSTIYGASSGSSDTTFPNSSQGSYFEDEYDYSDYEGWLDEFEDCEEWDCDEWWDGNTESWHVRAVNEAIAEENGDTPPPPDSMGDIPF